MVRALADGMNEKQKDGSQIDTETGTRLYPLRDSLGNIVPIGKLRGATPYDYLEAGEAYIREHGWFKGDWGKDDAWREENTAVCALGGMMRGANTLQKQREFPMHLMRNLRCATEHLYMAIPADKFEAAITEAKKDDQFSWLSLWERNEAVVAAYNDLPDTTEEAILALFARAKETCPRETIELLATSFNEPIFVPEDEAIKAAVLAWCEPAVDARVSV